MVRIAILATFIFTIGCSRPFVLKPDQFQRPVMVGDIRQIGGKKITPAASEQKNSFAATIEILDTPTESAQDWYVKAKSVLDSRLNAATLIGARDAQITELKFGSYVLNFLLFYYDKDWMTVKGHTLPRLYDEPARVYMLNPPIPKIRTTECEPGERCRKKSHSKRKRSRR